MHLRSLFLLPLLLMPWFLRAQNARNIDSLEKAYAKCTSDTARFNNLLDQVVAYRYFDADKAMAKCLEMKTLSEKINLPKYKGRALFNMAIQQRKQGDYEKAVKNYLEALAIFQAAKDESNTASCYGSLGITFWQQGDLDRAIDYLRKSQPFMIKLGKKANVSANCNNIAGVYMQKGLFDSALVYINQSLQINIDLKDTASIADAYGNIGSIYLEKKDTAQGLHYSLMGIDYALQSKNNYLLVTAYGNVGSIYFLQKKYAKSEDYFSKALGLDTILKYKEGLKATYKSLAKLYAATGNHEKAYRMMQKYSDTKDSLYSEAKMKQISDMDEKYKSSQKDKELLEAKVKSAEQDKQYLAEKADSEHKSGLLNVLYVVLALALGLAFFIFRGYINKKKAGIEISRQKSIIEEKSKEILDSIHYAERIQRALLPSDKVMKQYLPDSFVFYRPKDIVAGDFYWMEQQGNLLFFAVGDCTGHGVPGALVSVVCINALNRAVKEFRITEPGLILDKVRELVVENFEKSEQDVRDGMDISLCTYDQRSGTLKWAGANTPAWFVKNGAFGQLTPDKQPIGKHTNEKPFVTQELQLTGGDCLYFFSDGYADQFGGPNGKKFKYKQLKELLGANYNRPMREQSDIISNTFESWKGNLEQVDDICIVGIRITNTNS